MNLKIKFFDELTTRELYEIVRARTEIFLMEQGIICRDFDGLDYDSLHCFLEQDGKIVAYLRAHHTDSETVKIGRVLSITHGHGHGARLLRESLSEVKKRMECKNITVNAQKHAQGFYEKLGFVVTGAEFLEENIVHVPMRLDKLK